LLTASSLATVEPHLPTGQASVRWDINSHFIEPGKPAQNVHIESVYGKLRDECRSLNTWKNLAEVRNESSEYRWDDSEARLHSTQCHLPPAEYARMLLTGEGLGGNAKLNPFCGMPSLESLIDRWRDWGRSRATRPQARFLMIVQVESWLSITYLAPIKNRFG